MIGRKILDQVDDLLDAPDLPTSRYLQPPPLRIDTNSRGRITPGAVLRERSNTTVNPNNTIHPPAISICTPNSTLTFGMPNPTTYCPSQPGSSCGSSGEASARSQRYSIAEQALASAFKTTALEPSPLELQIFSLQKATAILNKRAKESRERAANLKLSLAERDTDPVTYVALQQERWMEEKRQFAVDKEVETLTQQLAKLKANRKKSRYEEENRGASPALSNEARQGANLARFLDYSPTRTSFPPNLKCRLALDQSFPRRMTMSDVSPLRLRPSSITPPLRRFTSKHARPASLAGEPFNPVKRPCRLRPGSSPFDTPLSTKAASHTAKVPSVSDSASSRSSARFTMGAPTDGSEGHAPTRPSTPPLSVASEASSLSQGICEETAGTATIISHVSTRTRSEILADLDPDDVHVPEYAMHLLGGFDLIHDEFTLPNRELFVKPREMKPIEVAPPPEEVDVPPPSEESDTGPYTSFALPPFTLKHSGSWSHIQFHPPPTSPSTPHKEHSSVLPQTPDSSSFSRSSTPTTPQASNSSKGPRPRTSLLFYMRKHRYSIGTSSPAPSSVRVESELGSPPSSPVVRKRFSFFARK